MICKTKKTCYINKKIKKIKIAIIIMNNWLIFLYEFIISFIALIFIFLSVKNLGKFTPFVIGAIICIALLLGAHVNPAVSTLFILTGKTGISSLYVRLLPQIIAIIVLSILIISIDNKNI